MSETNGRLIKLETGDGIGIAARLYAPVSPCEMTALMLPGIGVPQRAFRHLAGWLSARRVRCLTLDYRGMGESGSTAGAASALLTTWARQDAVAALEYIEESWSEPVVLIGHSFGGQMLGLAEALHRVRAAILIGSQFGQSHLWDGFPRLGVFLYWHLVLPLSAALFNVVPGWTGIGYPLPRRAAQQWALWGRSRNWYLDHERSAERLLGRFARPILAYGIDDDAIAPPRAVSALLERFVSTVPTRRNLVPGTLGLERLGHMGLLLPGPTEAIWQEMLEFLISHVAPDLSTAAATSCRG